MVTALAGVAPVIARSHERLDALLGRWVEAFPTARYAVTPLLQGTGDDVLGPDLRRMLHGAAADVYLEQRILHADETWEASRYLAAIEDWLGLARFILGLGIGARTAVEAHAIAWIPFHFLPGTAWPAEIPHLLRVVVRAVQARILLLQNLPAGNYEADLERLISAAGPEDAPAVAVARYATALPEAVPAAETARRAIEAARAVRQIEHQLPEAPRVPPEQLFWAAGLHVRGTDDLAALVPVIRNLTTEERRLVFAAEPGYDGAIILVELAYLLERATAGPTDWETVDKTLTEPERLGQLDGAEPLRAAALRVRALLISDVRRQPEDALALLDQHLREVGDETRFVLEGTRACVLLANDRSEERTRDSRQRSHCREPTLARSCTTSVFAAAPRRLRSPPGGSARENGASERSALHGQAETVRAQTRTSRWSCSPSWRGYTGSQGTERESSGRWPLPWGA